MNYAEIKYYDIANGPGVRVTLFVSGCTHRCKNCFNEIAWDFSYGQLFTEDTENDILKACESDYISGISVLGGEPFEPENQSALIEFLIKFKNKFPNKSVWCYSGYVYEQIIGEFPARCFTDKSKCMLNLIDVLVDGKFVEELHSLKLKFKGSSNQRIIDMNKTRQENKLVLWETEK